MATPRGLTMFISDIRNCTTKEQEVKRVDKELAHIRKQFGDKSIDGYNMRKYSWKLLYMYMLGYDIEIGHMEALKLITSAKFSEKNAGYMACAVLWNENTEFLRLLVQSVRKDLMPTNEINQCLALSFAANIGGMEFAEGLAQDVQKLLISGKSRSFVRKKSALCLLRLFRKSPECIGLTDDNFPSQLLNLLDDPNIGVCTSVMSLLLGLVSHHPAGFEGAVEKCILLLSKLVFSKEKRSIYRYYLTLCPWLQVKCLRLLQYYPPPSSTLPAGSTQEKNLMARLTHVLNDILTKTVITKNVNKNNADHSVLFEAINVIIHYCTHGMKEMQGVAIGLLGRFISIREANFRYLGLETMTKLAHVSGSLVAIKKHQEVIQASLQDPDVSIRKRALDLLYVMCDKSNAVEIVNALVAYLATATFEMREELVLKIAILAEKFASDLKWYVDVILQLITLAGDFVTDDIWYRVVQIVTNHEELQDYAASTCYKFLDTPVHIHENGIKVGAYILGEFGEQISDKALTGQKLFDVLQTKFPGVSNPTKALLLSAYVKMANTYPDLKQSIGAVLDAHRSYVDTEIQQRACEYFVLNTASHAALMESVLDVMPNYSERESLLLKRIKKSNKSMTDRDVWGDKDPEAIKARESDEAKAKAKEAKQNDDDDDDDDSSDDDSSSDDSSDSSDSDSDEEGSSASAKAPKATKPPPGGAGIDLLGLGSNPAVAASANGSSAAASSSSAAAAGTNATPVGTFPPQAATTVQALLGKESGVLYETRDLQIGVKLTVENNNSVKMVFYYGNRCPNTIKDVSAVLPEGEGGSYKLQVRPADSFEVPPKKQIMQFFLFHCFKPFKGPVDIKINFNYLGKAHTLALALPLFLSTFVVPTSLDGAAFVGAWTKYGNELVGTRKTVDGSILSASQVTEKLQSVGHLFVVAGVEKSAENVVAAGTFHTATKNAAGANVVMPCLVRVETKPNVPMMRITVRSGHQTVSDALIHTIAAVLNARE